MMYEICAITDVGIVRDNNEDGFYTGKNYAYKMNYVMSYEKSESPCIIFIADGVGSCEQGEIAVEECIKCVREIAVPSTKDELQNAIYKMNEHICDVTNKVDTAAAISGILISKERIAFNVGDSKIFAVNNGYLEQLSIDDTFSGISGNKSLTENEPLLQYLGKKSVTPHFTQCDRGNEWLICSDGLTDMVSIDKIEEVLSMPMNIQDKCYRLVEDAKNNGGYDNITVILIKECEANE